MTTYTAIPNGDIDPESPITTGLMTLLRDNPIAITEGAAGAPRISPAAFSKTGAVASSASVAAIERFSVSRTSNIFGDPGHNFLCNRAGSIRVGAFISTVDVTNTVEVQFTKNGSQVGSTQSHTGDTNVVEKTQDITVSVGDVIGFMYRSVNGSSTVYFRESRLYVDYAVADYISYGY